MAQAIGLNPFKDPHGTHGEEQVFKLLWLGLKPDDDAIVFCQPPIGHRKPDFVIYHQKLGIFVIEVKDWSVPRIVSVSPTVFKFVNGEEHPNPYDQAHLPVNMVRNKLKSRSAFRRIPCNRVGVFVNITRADAVVKGIPEVVNDCCLYADEIALNPSQLADRQSLLRLLRDKREAILPFDRLTDDEMIGLKDTLWPGWKNEIIRVQPELSMVAGLNFTDTRKFRDRKDILPELEAALEIEDGPVLTCLCGPSGIGKTAVLAKLGERIERGEIGAFGNARPILYVDCHSLTDPKSAASRLENLFRRICLLLDGPASAELAALWYDKGLSVRDKTQAMLSRFTSIPRTVLLDNLQELLDKQGNVGDPSTREFLDVCLRTPHCLRFVAASTVEPACSHLAPGNVVIVNLLDGLPVTEAVSVLREFDPSGKLGLQTANTKVLEQFAIHCKGQPSCLKAIAATLAQFPSKRVGSLLSELDTIPSTLAEDKFQRLNTEQRKLVEVLALFDDPVGLDGILATLGGEQCESEVATVVDSLVEAHYVLYDRVADAYALPSIDRKSFIARQPDEASDLWDRESLKSRQAGYYLTRARACLSSSRAAHRSYVESLNWSNKAIALSLGLGDNELLGAGKLVHALALNLLHRFDEALSYAEEARKISQKCSDVETFVKAVCLLISVESAENPSFGRLEFLATARETAEGEPILMFRLWQSTATVALRRRLWDVAEGAISEMMVLVEDALRPFDQAVCQQMLGELRYHTGDYDNALACLLDANARFEDLSSAVGECASRGWIGLTYLRLGKETQGCHFLESALLTECVQLRSREGVSKWLHHLGAYYAERGLSDQALPVLWMARDLRERLGSIGLGDTNDLIETLKTQIGASEYNRIQENYVPAEHEFGKYAFLWSIGTFKKHGPPLIVPTGDGWESLGTFNPAAWSEGEVVHLWYRAETASGRSSPPKVSQIGYGRSFDGVDFKRDRDPVLSPREMYELPGGCEDPRVVKIDDTYYMTYTAYDNRIARLSMAVSTNGRDWERWGPVFTLEQWEEYFPKAEFPMEKPGWTKSGAILDQQVNGRWWMYFGDRYVWAAHSRNLRDWLVVHEPVFRPRPGYFDSELVEPGPPPILRETGVWLGYNGAAREPRDSSRLRYCFGECLFDLDDPTRLVERCKRPILEPDSGDDLFEEKGNIVFGSGLVQFRGRWHLYYGMGDQRLGLATAPYLPTPVPGRESSHLVTKR